MRLSARAHVCVCVGCVRALAFPHDWLVEHLNRLVQVAELTAMMPPMA